MNSVLTPPRRGSAQLAGVAVIVIGFALVLGGVLVAARLTNDEPALVRRLTVENPTPYFVNVEVSGAERDSWIELGSFGRERSRTVEELVDQGRQWVFRFSYAGVEGGELVVSRDRLVGDGWRITVPPEVTERLRAAGLAESAS